MVNLLSDSYAQPITGGETTLNRYRHAPEGRRGLRPSRRLGHESRTQGRRDRPLGFGRDARVPRARMIDSDRDYARRQGQQQRHRKDHDDNDC